MKIDRSKLRKSSSQVPPDCKAVIERLRNCGEAELLAELNKFETWNLGRCELFHWIEPLDVLDAVLEQAAARVRGDGWLLACDMPDYAPKRELLLQTLHFTALLIEHSFSRHLYNSVEHLIQLLEASDMQVVLHVLNLIYMFSKRSNFISRLSSDRREALVVRLYHLAESWGGRENGFGLAECCRDVPVSSLSPSATTLHFEYYQEEGEARSGAALQVIHLPSVDQHRDQTAGLVMERLLANHKVPHSKQVMVFTYLRLAKLFSDYQSRLCCVQARLQAISILIYSHTVQDTVHTLVYAGLLEELVEILEMSEGDLVEIKAAALRTLTSITHLERTPNLPKLNTIIEITGANTFHGFLPQMVRTCINCLTMGVDHPLSSSVLTTALFSFLYHLASYETGGEALVHCGMMESLLAVVSWAGRVPDHVTFVTRAVRVIDLITNIDMTAFQAHCGLQKFVDRLEAEVNICRQEQPYQIPARTAPPEDAANTTNAANPSSAAANTAADASTSAAAASVSGTATAAPTAGAEGMEVDSTASAGSVDMTEAPTAGPSSAAPAPAPSAAALAVAAAGSPSGEVTCLPQRSALLKSMLNFLKKAIQDPSFSDSIRHLMEGSLPNSLKHIISNAEYYGASLFLLAIDVVTVYAFQEPSLLSSLQDNGLTDVVLHALIVKEVPATREVLSSLPNVFSALCLNTRGLEAFVAAQPFERLFRVLLSPEYLPAMRRRRGSEPMSDTATKLGNAMDELMRHQPSLRVAATESIIRVLEKLCEMGRDPQYMCSRAAGKPEPAPGASVRSMSQEGGSSDEEDEEEDLAGDGGEASDETPARGAPDKDEASASSPAAAADVEKQHVPLIDYVHNVMKFVDAILSNNSTDDHCREFVSQQGLAPLLGILGLPNLPLDFPQSPACQAVASVCKSILNLAHEGQVLREGLSRLSEVLTALEPLHTPPPEPGTSVLLRELASAPPGTQSSPRAAPLLHAMSAAHAYIATFIHICRTSQTDIRQVSVNSWGSDRGLAVLRDLSRLYTSIVWESTVLMALCTHNSLPADTPFAREDMNRILENRQTDPLAMEDSAEDSKVPPSLQYQMKVIKPVLASTSKLCRTMTDLFSLLVKLCVGSPIRQRRGQQLNNMNQLVSPAARKVAREINSLLTDTISFRPKCSVPTPKLRLTFYTCTLSFISSMLFDEKKLPYHLMLQLFRAIGGLDAFFETFQWALSMDGKVAPEQGLEHPELPDGTAEFLDSWLVLLERLVSPKHILETPHTLPKLSTDGTFFRPFDPHKFMAGIHKSAFKSVMLLWNRQPLDGFGGRLSISILAILRHVLRGEVILKERREADSAAGGPAAPAEPAAGPSSAAASDAAVGRTQAAATGTATEGAAASAAAAVAAAAAAVSGGEAVVMVNTDQLQQLLDMGFPRQACVEALQVTNNNVEQATDYLLSHPPPSLPEFAGVMSEWSEGGQIARGIDMSLGSDRDPAERMDTSDQRATPAEERQVADEEPLSAGKLDSFTSTVLDGCLKLLDALSDTVYRTCDLIVTCIQRNGAEWRDQTLRHLAAQVCSHLEDLLRISEQAAPAEERLVQLTTSPSASKAAVRVHLFSLLFEEMHMPCALVATSSPLIPLCVQLLCRTELLLASAGPRRAELASPRWLAPLVVFVDLCEKIAVASQRKAAVAQITGHQWRWFDLGSGKWCGYPSANNKAIDDAYWAGEPQVQILTGRRKYNIIFNSMVQVNEETNNRRPVMICLADRPSATASASAAAAAPATATAAATAATAPAPAPATAAATAAAATDSSAALSAAPQQQQQEPSAAAAAGRQPSQQRQPVTVDCLTDSQCSDILSACVGLLAAGVDADTLQAVLRLCLRLTRQHSMAVRFAELGGIRHLLALRQASSFAGLNTLATFLVRHTMEDSATLRFTMEKILRTATMANNTNYREFHYMMRTMGPAACRSPDDFIEVAKETLRVDIGVPPRRAGEEDQRLIMKAVSARAGAAPAPASACAQAVVEALLDALVVPTPRPETEAAETGTEGTGAAAADTASAAAAGQSQVSDVARPSSSSAAGSSSAGKDGAAGKDGKTPAQLRAEEAERRRRPLLAKSSVCRLLAELVRSYATVAKIVTEYTYTAGPDSDVTEDCPPLAYILDRLVAAEPGGDKECASSCRLLVAAIAACNHSPDAQTALVAEVRQALWRALQLPETGEKHGRIQALVGLVFTMIDSCPSSGPQPLPAAVRSSNLGMNNIAKIMVRRGLPTDLARISHSLDLSSPHMASTMNAVLKPLELLTRMVNSPSGAPAQRRLKTTSASHEATQPNTEPTSNSEATRAQGESMLEDPENTEHDVSVTEATSEAHPADGAEGDDQDQDEVVLEEIMDQLLERNPDGPGETILAEALILDGGGGGGSGSSRMETEDGPRAAEPAAAVSSEQREDSDAEEDGGDGEEEAEEEEEPEQEDDEDEDEDDEEEEEDDEEGSNYDEDGDDADLEEEMMMMIQGGGSGRMMELEDLWMVHPEPSGTASVLFGGDQQSAARFIPMAPVGGLAVADDAAAADSAPAAPSGSGQVLPVHPLLTVRSSSEAVVPLQRSRRAGHQRGYRYIQVNTRQQPPAILQRLLGPSAQDALQLSINSSSLRDPPFLLSDPQDFRVITHRSDDDWLDLTSSLGGLVSGAPSGGSLASIPSALSRWTEESRVLDTVGLYDCVTACKPEVLTLLETSRDQELAERRKQEEERRRQEEAAETASAPAASEGGAAASQSSPAVSSAAGQTATSTTASASASASAVAAAAAAAATTGALATTATATTATATTATTGAAASPSSGGLRVSVPANLSSVSRYVESILSPAMLAFTSSAASQTAPASVLDTLSRLQSTVGQLPASSSPEVIMDTLLSEFGATGIRAGAGSAAGLPLPPPDPAGSVSAAASASGPSVGAVGTAPAAMETQTARPGTEPTAGGAESAVSSVPTSAPASDLPRVSATPSGTEQPPATSCGIEPQPSSAAGESTAAPAESTAGPAADFSSILGDLEVPEGVDPSFLAALPDDMRQEVVAEQLRLQRIRQRFRQAQTSQQQPTMEVSPEFLEALPPAIQEEVLAQQRMEQHRAAVASALPDDPVDPGDFLQTLPPPLRQTILTDLEDSQLGVLPPSMAEEAQTLRREWEARNRQHPYEPIDYSVRSRLNQRYAFHLSSSMPLPGMRPSGWRSLASGGGSGNRADSSAHLIRLRGRQLLDQESITCLLVLLFLDEPKLHTSRLHRVLRNLSYHWHTREWIVRALLSMLDRSDSSQSGPLSATTPTPVTPPTASRAAKRRQITATPEVVDVVGVTPQREPPAPSATAPSWLNISMDAALGCRANVFQLQRTGPATPVGGAVKRLERATHMAVHPQAASVVCRHALDALISLAKSFPSNFLPAARPERPERRPAGWRHADLWELLLKLDAQAGRASKGKSLARTHSGQAEGDDATPPTGLAASAFGHLMAMLDHPVIKKSSQLTDLLLRLLSFMSAGVRDLAERPDQLGDLTLMQPLIGRAVRVLTSKSCSEEGMDDATKLLVHISSGPTQISNMVMDLLLEGARTLGRTVCDHIESLRGELDKACPWLDLAEEQSPSEEEAAAAEQRSTEPRTEKMDHGVIQNRYTSEDIVINASKRLKSSAIELRLPSMNALTSKGSSQQFFLRILKVIIQLRNSAVAKSVKAASSAPGTSRPAAAESTEAVAGTASQSQSDVAGAGQSQSDVAGVGASQSQSDVAGTESQSDVAVAGASQSQSGVAGASQSQSQSEAVGEVAAESEPVEAAAVDAGSESTVSEASPNAMEVDTGAAASGAAAEEEPEPLPALSRLLELPLLWETLSQCLRALEHTPDQHAVLILQPAVEAFFLVHAAAEEHTKRQPQTRQEQLSHIADSQPLSPLPSSSAELQAGVRRDEDDDTRKFLQFAEQHRTVLNQILRQSGTHLSDGPFSVLVNHTRVLDFDIKRRFFRTELERLDEGLRREDLAVHVRRAHVFEDSYRELHRRTPEEWKNRFYIVFEGEEGQDAGGLLREWYIIISRDIFNPMYALFCTSPGDRVTYMIHHMSHCNSNHLSYFKFVGRVIAKAIYDNKLLDCYFTRSFYKHILGISVKYTDMEAEDYEFYKGLVYLIENDISEMGYELTFSTDVQEFGVNEVRDLKPRGRHIKVTEENKMEYVRLVCQMKMTGAIQKQLKAFLEGFYDIIPKHLISVFNEQELELLVSGLPTIDLDDLKANTEYHKYQPNSLQIQWFWLALRSFSNEDRAKFIQFVTGTSRVPLQGFAELQGMNGAQKFQIHRDDRSTDRLPSAHTCFNQLDLPAFETYDKLRENLLKAVQECSEGFGFA